MITVEGPSPLWLVPPLGRVSWVGIQNQTEEVREPAHKQWLHGICFSSCLQVPPALSFCLVFPQSWYAKNRPNEPLPGPYCFCSVLYHSNRKQTRIGRGPTWATFEQAIHHEGRHIGRDVRQPITLSSHRNQREVDAASQPTFFFLKTFTLFI